MNLATLAAKNLTRNKLRVTLTLIGILLVSTAYVLSRTVLWGWSIGAELASRDRIATRNKVSVIQTLPIRYAEDVKQIPGIKEASYFNWFGPKDPNDKKNAFAAFAVSHKTFFDVYPDVIISKTAHEHWRSNPKALLVGDRLAKRMKLEEGSRLVLRSEIYPGDWEFDVVGIYTVPNKAIDEVSMFLRWDYFNEKIPAQAKNKIGWILTSIDDPTRSGEISKAIDALFAEREDQSISMTERALQMSFLGMFISLLRLLDWISIILLGVMGLIIGNTIAMGVRERSFEYGVMRAIGVPAWRIASTILGEAILIGFLGGLAGVVLGALIIPGLKVAIDQSQAAAFFPVFELSTSVLVTTVACCSVMGVPSALVPAVSALRKSTVEALRRIG